jgi:hypothetical protein
VWNLPDYGNESFNCLEWNVLRIIFKNSFFFSRYGRGWLISEGNGRCKNNKNNIYCVTSFIYLWFVYSAVRTSDNVASKDRIISECWVEWDVEKSGCGTICDIIPAFSWRGLYSTYSDGPPYQMGSLVRHPRIRFPAFPHFWEAVGLERGPLSLVRTTEELLGRNSSGSGQENRD